MLTAEWRPWAARMWRYSTTLGRGIIYQPEHRARLGSPWTRIQHHEHLHVRQTEDLMLLGLILGTAVAVLTQDWTLGAVLWWSSGMWQVPNFLTAWMRGGHPYRDAEHEIAAYAATDEDAEGWSWLKRHRARTRP